MRALFIGPEQKTLIAAAIAAARANPVAMDTVVRNAEYIDQDTDELALADRPPGFEPPGRSQHVAIPNGYHAAISFEEQPAGLVRHLSISVETKTDAMPHPLAILAIARAFGFDVTDDLAQFDRVWSEEYEPGRWAVNVLQIDQETRQ